MRLQLFPGKQPRSTRKAHTEGSALLLTLMMVSLLLVIVLSFVVYVRMELRRMANRQELEMARANARLGANMAIARLQELAGADTRVTAPVTNPANPNNRFVGQVFDASPFNPDGAGGLVVNSDYTQNIGVLLSGDSFDPETDSMFSSPGEPADEFTILVGDGTVDDPDEFIAAPLEELSPDNGAYAWWVSDEGLKAQVNVTDPIFESTNDRSSAAQILTAQRTGSEAILAGYDPEDGNHNEILRRAYNLEQLNLVAGNKLAEDASGTDLTRTLFHSLSMQSHGLLTNTKRGGLKRDLTAVIEEAELPANGGNVPAFNDSDPDPNNWNQWTKLLKYQESRIERYAAETAALDAAGFLGDEPGSNRYLNALQALTLRSDQNDPLLRDRIFPPVTDLDVIWDQGGAAWEDLITWATLIQRNGGSGEVTPEPRYLAGNGMSLSPVITNLSLSQYATIEYPEALLHWVPSVTLWNPYNVPLRMDPSDPWKVQVLFSLSRTRNWMRLKLSNPSWESTLRAAGFPLSDFQAQMDEKGLWTPRFELYWNVEDGHSGTDEQFVFQIDLGSDRVLEPGEAVMFTMHEHVDATAGDYGKARMDFSADPIILRRGLAVDGNYSVYNRTNIHRQLTVAGENRANPDSTNLPLMEGARGSDIGTRNAGYWNHEPNATTSTARDITVSDLSTNSIIAVYPDDAADAAAAGTPWTNRANIPPSIMDQVITIGYALKGFNSWHPCGIDSRGRYDWGFPFPLDPSALNNPEQNGKPVVWVEVPGGSGGREIIPATAQEFEDILLWAMPADMDMCINTNGFNHSSWEILEVGLETNRNGNGGNEQLTNLQINLYTDSLGPWFPLYSLIKPYNFFPSIMRGIKSSDVEHITEDKRDRAQAIYSPFEAITLSDAGSFDESIEGYPGWSLHYLMRLPDNDYGRNEASQTNNFGQTAPIRWLSDFNPTSPFQARDPSSRMERGGGFWSIPAFTGGFTTANPRLANLSWMVSDENSETAFVGHDEEVPFGLTSSGDARTLIYDIPSGRNDITSVGALMNAAIIPSAHALMPTTVNGFPEYRYGDGVAYNMRRLSTADQERLIPFALARYGADYSFMQPANMIGNSYAHMMVERGRAHQTFYPSDTYATPDEYNSAAGVRFPQPTVPYLQNATPNSISHKGVAWGWQDIPPRYFPGYDSSWMYNEVLWDDFFFTPTTNSRFVWTDGIHPEDSTTDTVERDFNLSAENVMVNGSFNVNSTSVSAWAVLLSSMMGVDVGLDSDPEDFSTFSRNLEPALYAYDPDVDDHTSASAFGGYRRLSPTEIWDNGGTPTDPSDDSGLAVEIVNQVLLRGPFMSLSDFVNRALLPNTDDPDGLGLAGALQTAIEDAGLNDSMGDPSNPESLMPIADMEAALFNPPGYDARPGRTNVVFPHNNWFGYDLEHVEGSRSRGAVGTLSQGDLLSRIGSVLQPRSDTFTIRAQGITGSIDSPNARAWCEITVQRKAEFVDSDPTNGNTPEAIPADLTILNSQFGRRFEIVRFRWLSEEDI